jgi:hypothetical protein
MEILTKENFGVARCNNAKQSLENQEYDPVDDNI